MAKKAATDAVHTSTRMSRANMDTHILRSAIVGALRKNLPKLSGVLLDVGCGHMPYRELVCAPPTRVERYIGLDLQDGEYDTPPDLTWDGKAIPLESGAVDSALATELFEHCPEPEAVMREIARVLKPGGVLFFTVPFVWPLHDVPHDEYRYTPFSLERHLSASGFVEIEMRALGGWDSTMALVLALWVRRRPMSVLKRRVLSALLLPFVRALHRHDRPPPRFSDDWLFPGIAGTAANKA